MSSKKGFGNGSKNRKDPIVSQVLSQILNDKSLCTPVYLPDIQTEVDAEKRAWLPLVYLWNEKRSLGSFSLSINGPIIADLLEKKCSRSDPQFAARRDEIMTVLSTVSRESVIDLCQKLGCMPSDVFKGK